jgi:hypothetical protein
MGVAKYGSLLRRPANLQVVRRPENGKFHSGLTSSCLRREWFAMKEPTTSQRRTALILSVLCILVIVTLVAAVLGLIPPMVARP